MECKFCHKTFSSKSNLNAHQKKSKYCLKIQGIDPNYEHDCKNCGKKFPTSNGLKRHLKICVKNNILLERYNNLKETTNSYSQEIIKLKSQLVEKDRYFEILRNDYKELVDKYVTNAQERVKLLTKKYVRKQPRMKFSERNVIYILTTALLKKERRYILGKAENLTNRLSTYNKSDEHEVVYYKSCGDKESMKIVENMVFRTLDKYRERANRERFILPEDEEIKLFCDSINKCIDFF